MDVNEELKFLLKFKKKNFEGGGGVRVDVIEEFKFLRKFTKKKFLSGVGGGSGWWGGQGGCERNVGG